MKDLTNYVGFFFKKGGKSKKGSGIHIKKSHEGLFTKKAKAAGYGVQEYARHVLANKGSYDSATVKQAVFAHNAAGFKHEQGGTLTYNRFPIFARGGKSGTDTYVVKSGDTLSGIASNLGVPLSDLIQSNNLADPNVIQPGQMITVPRAGPVEGVAVEQPKFRNGQQAIITDSLGNDRLTEECAEWANWALNNTYGKNFDISGNAWNRNSKRNVSKVLSGYDGLNSPDLKSLDAIKQYVYSAADRFAQRANLSAFKDGDIVGLYYKYSPYWQQAASEGTHGAAHTHTGNIRIINGVPYVEHNIHGKIHVDSLADILGSNHTWGVTEVYRPRRKLFGLFKSGGNIQTMNTIDYYNFNTRGYNPFPVILANGGTIYVPYAEGGLRTALKNASTLGQKAKALLTAPGELLTNAVSGIYHPIKSSYDQAKKGVQQIKQGWQDDSIRGIARGVGNTVAGVTRGVFNASPVGAAANMGYGLTVGDRPESTGSYDEYINGPSQNQPTQAVQQPAAPTRPALLPIGPIDTGPAIEFEEPNIEIPEEEIDLGPYQASIAGHTLNRRQAKRTANGRKVNLGNGQGRQRLSDWEGRNWQNVGRRGTLQNNLEIGENYGTTSNFQDKNGNSLGSLNRSFGRGGKIMWIPVREY